MNPGDGITLLRACNGGALRKFVHPSGDITRPNLKYFDLIEQPLAEFASLEQLLRKLEDRADYAVIRGTPADPNRVIRVRKLFHADRETGDAPTIVEMPRRWVAFDIDDIPRPDWVDATDLVGCAAIAAHHLPVEFKHASLVVQATASHGIKPGLRLRLWAWLSRPVGAAELKWWLRDAPADSSVFRPSQIIITAAPIFLQGAVNPLSSRMVVIPGQGEVEVPAPEQLRPPPASVPKRPQPSELRRAIARRNISGLVRTVANAADGNRNRVLYWAACRAAEDLQLDAISAAAELQAAAEAAGVASRDAAATIRSAFRGRS